MDLNARYLRLLLRLRLIGTTTLSYLSNEMDQNHSVGGVIKSAISLFHSSISHQLSTAPQPLAKQPSTSAYQRMQRKYI